VDREEVEDQGRDQNDRMGAALPLCLFVANQKLAEQELGFLRSQWREDNLLATALIGDDQVLVALQVAAVAASAIEEQAVRRAALIVP